MFEKLVRQLESLERMKLSIPINSDDNGYLDKECPNEDCLFQFKVKEEDWQNLFSDEAVYCPKCRHKATADSWWTTEQIEVGKKQALKQVSGIIGNALRQSASDFNRKQPRDGFIKLSLEVKGAHNHVIVPIPAQKEMQLEIACEKCTANFAVIGSAFFCPCCGYNSVERTYDDAIKKVQAKINNLDLIKNAFKEIGNIDEGEVTCLSLIETGLTDCVVAFQRFSEESYRKLPNSAQIPFNAFQRLDQGSKLWKETISEGYEEWLLKSEQKELNILFQKRHLLAHSEGIVDAKYIEKSSDTKYQVGQRIVVKEKDVQRLIELTAKIVKNIRLKTR